LKLGILVNTDKHLRHIIGITQAAVSRGHEVIIFNMDQGSKLLEQKSFCALSGLHGVTISFCSLNSKQAGVNTASLSGEVMEGSQYNNAVMNHQADKVIIL
jgi:peroxiredoxin family protein